MTLDDTYKYSSYKVVDKTFVMLSSVIVGTLLGAVVAFKNPNYRDTHDTMVHLFEWKFSDIADECERFFGPIGYGGIQVSPIQENVIISSRPWWERYQPISYKWITRSGNETAFRDMVKRCNKVGVRIYVDAVINHMSGNHDNAVGTGGSTADTYNYQYYAVPYGPNDFNIECSVSNYEDPSNVRNCELVGLHDLNQSSDYVKEKIVNFMNAAIEAGVAGFRIDAAKHMWPKDLTAIYGRLNNLNTDHGFPSNSSPYIYQEVIDLGGEGVTKMDYVNIAAVTEFKYGYEISNALHGNNLLKWFVNWGEAWALVPSEDALVFIDNHDNQRGHGGAGSILTYKDARLYKMAIAFMLAHPYGTARIMSSYRFNDTNAGPPADSNGNIISPSFNADDTCNNNWVCEHRWRQIYNMVRFRNTVKGTSLSNWWDNDSNQIAFCRGSVGFIAINADSWDLRQRLQTCLPAGKYCDLISGNLGVGSCTGKTVDVGEDGMAYIEILTSDEDGVLAIYQNGRL